ncbi:MAG: hypothetical protein ACOX8A_10835 [Thermacetogeniaceae bacterium]
MASKDFRDSFKKLVRNLDKNGVPVNLTDKDKIHKEIMKCAIDLRDQIRREIGRYYRSYQPVVYKRTYRLARSVVIQRDPVNGVYVTFDSERAHRRSIIHPDDDNQVGYVPILINNGWMWRGVARKLFSKSLILPPYRFAYFIGDGFIERAVKEIKKKYPKINIEIVKTFNGKRL